MALLQIAIPKAKGVIEIDTDEIAGEDFPEDVYREILIQGLKVLLNRGMSKLTTTGLKGEKLEEAQAAVMAVAQENLAKVRAGQIKRSGGNKAKGISGAVKTEAMRLARALVKDALKRDGKKVSHIAAKDITAAATELLDGEYGKEIIKQAQVTILAREEEEKKMTAGLTAVVSKIKVSAKLVAEAEAKNAEAKAATAAKKAASQVAHRTKPQAESRAQH